MHVLAEIVFLDDVVEVGEDLRLLDIVFFPWIGEQVFFVPGKAIDVGLLAGVSVRL